MRHAAGSGHRPSRRTAAQRIRASRPARPVRPTCRTFQNARRISAGCDRRHQRRAICQKYRGRAVSGINLFNRCSLYIIF